MKISRQRKTKNPCQICFLHQDLCICAVIPRLTLATRIVLVVHAKELKRTTNTGRLAMHALVNSEMIVRGQNKVPVDLTPLLQDTYETFLFYPSEEAVELSEIVSVARSKPIQLIVPDGNWRQASKVSTRHPELAQVPRVKISEKNLASYHLRKEHFAEGLSTLEAIAKALGLIEGSMVGDQLLRLYQAKLKATMLGRGLTKQ
ncbi:MAG: DTW domain-containing protein [Bdellovibrionaceae bacterium]|nr:DTW domain-containing protein [Pseudobdellovibrionaceae bacterium]